MHTHDEHKARWPIDFDSLAKGTTITIEQLEAATRTNRGSDRFDIAVLRLAARIEDELATRLLHVTVARRGNALRVLTDSEAAMHNDNLFRQAIRAMRRRVRKQGEVDVSNLTDDERRGHERALSVNVATYLAAATARKQSLLPSAHVRATPSLRGGAE